MGNMMIYPDERQLDKGTIEDSIKVPMQALVTWSYA